VEVGGVKTWLLTVTFYEVHAGMWSYRRWSAKGRDAVEAYLTAIDEHQAYWKQAREAGADAARAHAHEDAYANAILLGAWPLNEAQTARAEEEGW